jgi:2-haloacid dehalogenase
MSHPLARVHTLTFDIFGTVLDLTGSIVPVVKDYLASKNSAIEPEQFWVDWRGRQRLEQHQDTILMLGHGGYLEVARRALLFTLRRYGVEFSDGEPAEIIRVFERLQPFEDARIGLEKLSEHYKLVALSNGNQWLIDHLTENNIGVKFDGCLSVERVGRFKPHPSVYRMAAAELDCAPGEIMMVAAHSFDILGARACGFRGTFVNRYNLPYEESKLQPDLVVNDFVELAEALAEYR